MHLTLPIALLLLALAAPGCEDNRTLPVPHAPYEAPAQLPLSCVPNLDGQIESGELAPTLGVAASFIVSPPLPPDAVTGILVDVAGGVDPDGRRVWDWSRDSASDQVARFTARKLEGQWFAESFPEGEIVLAIDAGQTLLGVYSHDETALRLHGIASAEEAPAAGKTLLVYEEPIAFFSFPLTVGQTWTAKAVVRDGTLRGITPWSQDEIYVNEVDSAGILMLPDFTFTQALRVRTHVTIQPLAIGEEVQQRQVTFLFECFGEVARATSLPFATGEPDPGPDFTVASEVRKLGWF